jgi:O-methyltransferase involved in polyketide biosynthesis
MFDALEPAMVASRAVGGPTLEGLLLSRHRVIDDLLRHAIEEQGVRQVIEPACGMSPRGWRFCKRYGDALTYIEGDLPKMADRKRRALGRIGSLTERHRVVDLDVLCDDGPESIAELTADLDRDRGLSLVTEGLLTYFDERQVTGVWRRFARVATPFAAGSYLADIRLGGREGDAIERSFGVALSVFVRGRVHTHFSGPGEALAALRAVGFPDARLRRCDQHPAAGDDRRDPGARRVQIIEASW